MTIEQAVQLLIRAGREDDAGWLVGVGAREAEVVVVPTSAPDPVALAVPLDSIPASPDLIPPSVRGLLERGIRVTCLRRRGSTAVSAWWQDGKAAFYLDASAGRAAPRRCVSAAYDPSDWDEPGLRGVLKSVHAVEPLGEVRLLPAGAEFRFLSPPAWANFLALPLARPFSLAGTATDGALTASAVSGFVFAADGLRAILR